VYEIDQYLGLSLVVTQPTMIPNGNPTSQAMNHVDALPQNVVVPIEYLDRIPWPTDWLLE
jgi:hypothetical protein